MNEPRLDHVYHGYEIYVRGISLECPKLHLYGFAYDRNLHREINRIIRKAAALKRDSK